MSNSNKPLAFSLLAIPIVTACLFLACISQIPAHAEEDESAYVNSEWALLGSCEWQINSDNCLAIRPLANESVGVLSFGSISTGTWPWVTPGESNWSIESVSFEGNIKPSTCEGLFYGLKGLKAIHGLDNLDTSDVDDFGYMFYECQQLEYVDLSSLDTSHASDFSRMFEGCRELRDLDLSNIDTTHAYDMRAMFARCSSLTELDLSMFDTSNVAYMGGVMHSFWGLETHGGMFSGCSSLESVDLSEFDTSNVKDMKWMFSGCSSLKALDLSAFDTSHVENMGSMFQGCSSIIELDLSSFDTLSLHEVKGEAHDGCLALLFDGCVSLEYLDISSFDTSNLDESALDDGSGHSGLFGRVDRLNTVVLGAKFTFQNELPQLVWYNSNGKYFTPSTIPNGVAGTYRTTYPIADASFLEHEKTVQAGSGAFAINYSIVPSEGYDLVIAWASSDTSVAVVDENGNVTPLKAGTAVITATVANISSLLHLTVTEPAETIVPVDTVVLDRQDIELSGKVSTRLTATVSPADATYKNVVWSSSNDRVVRVSSSGEVTATGKGTATITAASQDGKASAACQVTVLNPIASISITGLPERFEAGSAYQLSVEYRGAFPGEMDMDGEPDITWELDNTDTATISANGKNAVLTCKVPGHNQLTTNFGYNGIGKGGNLLGFNVVWPNPDSIVISETSKSVIVGADPFTLTTEVKPAIAANIPVSWTSTDPSVATVDDTGRVTILKRGNAIITARAGNKSASCTVKVDGCSFPVVDNSEFDGYVMADDSNTAGKLKGLRLRIKQSDRVSSDKVRQAALASAGTDDAIYVDAIEVDFIDDNGDVRAYNEPNNAIAVYVALDEETMGKFDEYVPGVHYVSDDAETTESKITRVEGNNLVFETTHFSTYAITATPKPVEGTGEGDGNGSPSPATRNNTSTGSLVNTGDNAFGVAALALVGCFAAGAVAVGAFRAKRKEE